jgi:hypothetical protein
MMPRATKNLGLVAIIASFLWVAVPRLLVIPAFFLDSRPILGQALVASALAAALVAAVLLVQPRYKFAVAHALAAFSFSAALYVWLTLGSFGEFSVMQLLEAFMPALIIAPVLTYFGAFVAVRRVAV